MPRRVSLKGKGADLFFGDFAPPASEPGADSEDRRDTMAPAVNGEPATLQASMQAHMPADGPVDEQPPPVTNAASRKQASRRTSQPRADDETVGAPITAEQVLDGIWSNVVQPAPITGSFRYTDRELAALTDAVYELSKRHGVKFSKQDVVRLALNAVLWDYRSNGDGSLLAGFVQRKKRQRGG